MKVISKKIETFINYPIFSVGTYTDRAELARFCGHVQDDSVAKIILEIEINNKSYQVIYNFISNGPQELNLEAPQPNRVSQDLWLKTLTSCRRFQLGECQQIAIIAEQLSSEDSGNLCLTSSHYIGHITVMDVLTGLEIATTQSGEVHSIAEIYELYTEDNESIYSDLAELNLY